MTDWHVRFPYGPGERFGTIVIPPLAGPWERAEWAADAVYRHARHWKPWIVRRSVAVNVDTGAGVVLTGGRVVRRFRIEPVTRP